MKTPFFTNIAQLEKELEHIRFKRTRTFNKVELPLDGDLAQCHKKAIEHLQLAINYLKNIQTK